MCTESHFIHNYRLENCAKLIVTKIILLLKISLNLMRKEGGLGCALFNWKGL
jgi:hypothetical protein